MSTAGLSSRNGWVARSAAVVALMVVMIAMCLTGTAQARSSGAGAVRPAAGAGSQSAKASTKECFYTFPSCSSTDPSVKFSIVSVGDTSACAFTTTVNWGDKDGTTKSYPGSPDGQTLVRFNHTYTDGPKTYAITISSTTTAGSCGMLNTTLSFTLDRICPSGTKAVGGSSDPDYCVPGDWNTEAVKGLTPGTEPLNVIISARSTVQLADIRHAMSGWDAVPTACLSPEKADVAGGKPVVQGTSWRLKGCIDGNILSLEGTENHARLWKQPIGSSKYGAWFISVSFETACVERNGVMVPVKDHRKYALKHRKLVWHCIDGSQGSIGSNGYDRGARSFVSTLETVGELHHWKVSVRADHRPAGKGEGHAGTGVHYNEHRLRRDRHRLACPQGCEEDRRTLVASSRPDCLEAARG